jgi:hypothetical protein
MRKHLQRFGNLFVIGLLRSPRHRWRAARRPVWSVA